MATQSNNADILHGELIRFLKESEEMRKAAQNSLKHSLWAGAGAFAGAMALGPAGGLVGGIAGSVAGYLQSDPYDGAVMEIFKLQGRKREVLFGELKKILLAAGATIQQLNTSDAFLETLRNFASQETVRNQIWRACMKAISR